jgi:hypothetical protein
LDEGSVNTSSFEEIAMKFLCLGYRDGSKWKAMSEKERSAFIEECCDFGNELHRNGHVVYGVPLVRDHGPVRIQQRDGRVEVTDGPFAENKEQLGGVLVYEARDLNHAIQLMSGHPGTRGGSFEILPVDESFAEQIEARRARSSGASAG